MLPKLFFNSNFQISFRFFINFPIQIQGNSNRQGYLIQLRYYSQIPLRTISQAQQLTTSPSWSLSHCSTSFGFVFFCFAAVSLLALKSLRQQSEKGRFKVLPRRATPASALFSKSFCMYSFLVVFSVRVQYCKRTNSRYF